MVFICSKIAQSLPRFSRPQVSIFAHLIKSLTNLKSRAFARTSKVSFKTQFASLHLHTLQSPSALARSTSLLHIQNAHSFAECAVMRLLGMLWKIGKSAIFDMSLVVPFVLEYFGNSQRLFEWSCDALQNPIDAAGCTVTLHPIVLQVP